MQREKLIVIDGNSIANRAFYGIRLLTNKEGLYTNAIYGFLNILFKYLDSENPDYLCVAFDMRAPTFRHTQFEGYKAQRKGMPEELAVQMPVLKELLEAMNVPILGIEGYEADDIIGTIAKQCEQSDIDCIIATGDRDTLQLTSDIVKVYFTSTKNGAPLTEVYDDKAVRERYGVNPVQLIDVKGLMGDPSDNIPGVAGIGEKTALSLIQEYGSLESVFENINKIKGAVKTKLEAGHEAAVMSKCLAAIDIKVPIERQLQSYRRLPVKSPKLKELLENLGFKSFLKRFDFEHSITPIIEQKTVECKIVNLTAKAHIDELIARAKVKGHIFYIVFPGNDGILSAAVSLGEGICYYMDFSGGMLCEISTEHIKPLFETDDIKKTGHNIKDDIVLLNSLGIRFSGLEFDTAIAAYIDRPSRSNYELGSLIQDILGISIHADEATFGKGKARKDISGIEAALAAEFVSHRLKAIELLYEYYKNELDSLEQTELFYNIELPLTEALAQMQVLGFKVDRAKLIEFSDKLRVSINELEGSIYAYAGKNFNINSPQQLGVVLFEDLKLPSARKTKTGYSTDVSVLEGLAGKHPIIELIKDYRQLMKLKSTYSEGLLQVINPKTEKIHSRFNQTVTVTGRISSTEPNLQNIPIRLALGREIRKMFIASDSDYVLLDADYSQIELRILAHISNDPVMIEAFLNNEDIHTITASQVFGVPLGEVTSQMRSNAKAVNFGIVYGISDFALSQDLKITRAEAKRYIEGYLGKYSGVREYMTSIIEKAKEQGFVETLLHRRRYIPELKSQKFAERSFGERVALNTPIQGSAADIIKIAMVKVYMALKNGGFKSRLILQVHDELIVETHRSEIKEVEEILKTQMENAYKLSVPLVAEVKQGNSWYEAK